MFHVKPMISLGPTLELACAHCGRVVPLTRSDQTYCTRRCKEQARKKRRYDEKKEKVA